MSSLFYLPASYCNYGQILQLSRICYISSRALGIKSVALRVIFEWLPFVMQTRIHNSI